jgi:hypothetical protein
MDNSAPLLWGILFGSIGMGYFIYGKKQGRERRWYPASR